jgi:hypothetical protein
MQAQVGDKIVISAHHVGEHERDGVIRAVRGANGCPPFVVQWSDSPHEVLFYPGPDATVVHYEHHGARA